jgi:tRNA dimethylallyltransferase
MKTAVAPLFLLGATGTGKSAAAIELARTHPRFKGAAILAMDAMQVYRGADIGTSKPTAAERAEFPHGGLDLAEFGESFDVAHYLEHAAAFLREQREAGRRVIIGGRDGALFPGADAGTCARRRRVRTELRAELAALSVEDLRERLEKARSGDAGAVDAGNPRRLARAIEVMEATGRSLRAWQEETPEPLVPISPRSGFSGKRRSWRGCFRRGWRRCFPQGWVEEVRGLMERHGEEAVRAFPAIGYREIGEICWRGMRGGFLSRRRRVTFWWRRGNTRSVS